MFYLYVYFFSRFLPYSKVSRQNTNNVSVQKKKILPQTGTKTTDIGILGLAFATAASLLGLISDKVNRKKHN
ncbi:LPXTG cell wall anchor domain-containing protein [Lactobacillus johnsonii]|uniref:LPXTG cell wall anchor domain-containing protein n=1 Tax=Lactobacillus johnsonii TaxID=33959 RepID=UPI001558A7BB